MKQEENKNFESTLKNLSVDISEIENLVNKTRNRYNEGVVSVFNQLNNSKYTILTIKEEGKNTECQYLIIGCALTKDEMLVTNGDTHSSIGILSTFDIVLSVISVNKLNTTSIGGGAVYSNRPNNDIESVLLFNNLVRHKKGDEYIIEFTHYPDIASLLLALNCKE